MVKRIAVVGSGIAGLGAARLLDREGHRVTLFEADPRAGGHSHTVDVSLDGFTHPVDTGFLVFNERTYPNLVRLFGELGVHSVPSEMSFSVRHDAARLEWAGTDLRALFADPRNAARPGFWAMLADIVRFNRETRRLLATDRVPDTTLAAFLAERRYRETFRDWYLLPMSAAIWSCPRSRILDFPLATFIRFCDNHGLLQLADRPQWRTVSGGAREYVARIVASLPDVRLACPVVRMTRRAGRIEIDSDARIAEPFDDVVLACHADHALRLLADASIDEQRLLSAIGYQANRVVLHTDTSLLPRRRSAWSAWNYLAIDDDGAAPVAVSYLINKLQPLPFRTPVIVTLNPPVEPRPASILGEFAYSHPVLDSDAIAAQRALTSIQGVRNTWYAGAWLGNGFHEDGLRAAHLVADGIVERERCVVSRAQREAA